MAQANAVNATTTGIVGYTGSNFTGTAVTAHNVIVGGSISSSLVNVAPSATSGVPLISQGASADPVFGTAVVAGGGTGLTSITAHNLLVGNGTSAATLVAPSATSGVALVSQGSSADPHYGTVAIAGGGTNATSFTQSNGIVAYNGTSLVNYAGPQLSSGGIYTNTSQTAFFANLSANTGNVTGDGTTYQVIFDTVQQQQGSAYNNATGVFTVPSTGFYLISYQVILFGLVAANTLCYSYLNGSGFNVMGNSFNPFAVNGAAQYINNLFGNALVYTTSGSTWSVQVNVSGNAAKNMRVDETSYGIGLQTYFAAVKLC